MTFNKLLLKIGVDKILHFFGGGLISSLFILLATISDNAIGIRTILHSLMGIFIVTVVSWIKEMFIDEEYNGRDITASVLGAVFVAVLTLLFVVFSCRI